MKIEAKPFSELNIEKLPDGLIPAIIQDDRTLKVLMLGYMNREAYEKSLAEGRVTFYSRTRRTLWTKGETSGNRLDARFFHSSLVSCRVNHVDGVVIEELSAIHLLDHRLWRFAFAEARQSDGLYLLFIRLHQSVLELLLAYLYQQFHRVVLKFVYRSQTHVVSIPFFILCRIG